MRLCLARSCSCPKTTGSCSEMLADLAGMLVVGCRMWPVIVVLAERRAEWDCCCSTTVIARCLFELFIK